MGGAGDAEYVGRWRGGEGGEGKKGEVAELTLYIDNTFGDHAALHKENDYYSYGGITRPAEVQYVPEVYIERVAATPRWEEGRWALEVVVELHNWSDVTLRRRVQVAVAGVEQSFDEIEVAAGERVVLTEVMRGLAVEPWSTASPTLYWVTTTLHDVAREDDGEHHEPVDDLIDRVGFREVRVDGKRLLLNGEPIRLRGFNRHEDHGCFGCAIPLEAMVRDLLLIRDMGGDFVRTCHYPNDQRFLDLCDEMGFYVWEESHYRQAKIDHPKFYEQVTRSTQEMMRWHHNHPSIIIWGCLNELPSDTPEGRDAVEHVTDILKRDDSRPCTFASHKNTKDLALGLVDIVAWNRYDAWYSSGVLDNIEPELQKVLKWLHSDASHGGAGKPVIMSEFGAGAIPGYHMPHHAKWTEEYQREALDESLRVYLQEEDVVGVAIWQFCDIRVTMGMAIARPRTMNNKGVVDEYRRPKLAYEAVKRRMEEAGGK